MAAMAGKLVLVTGGARRIGRGIAVAMARAGADVAITYRTSAWEARRTVRELERLGGRAMAVRCDVRSERSVRAAVGAVVRRLGGLDVLVNNAGVYETAPLEKITAAQWRRMMESNLVGPYLVTRAALGALRRRHGRVVNLGSLGGLRPWTTHAHYCASKAALHMLTRVMAKGLAPEIAVNCVAPGMIDMDPAGKRTRLAVRLATRTPMRRGGRVEDVVAAVMFFATAPEFITGQVLAVDGGLGLT